VHQRFASRSQSGRQRFFTKTLCVMAKDSLATALARNGAAT